MNDSLYHDPDLTRFYDLENGWREDFDYCVGMARGALSVLDLGCGTGQLAAVLANDGARRVVGVDPLTRCWTSRGRGPAAIASHGCARMPGQFGWNSLST